MTRHTIRFAAVTTAVAFMLVALGAAETHAGVITIVPIVNGDFEADAAADDLTGTTPAETPTGWYATVGGGDGPNLKASGGESNSQYYQFQRANQTLWQPLAHAWTAGDTFTIDFWGRDIFNENPVGFVKLYESDSDDGDLSDNVLLGQGTSAEYPNAGGAVQVVIDASTFTTGTQGTNVVLWFGVLPASNDLQGLDSIALSVEFVPAPAALPAGLGLMLAGAARRRRRPARLAADPR